MYNSVKRITCLEILGHMIELILKQQLLLILENMKSKCMGMIITWRFSTIKGFVSGTKPTEKTFRQAVVPVCFRIAYIIYFFIINHQ